MRIFMFYIIILTILTNSVSAQSRVALDGPSRAADPLVLVDTFKTDIKHLILNPQKIESIDVFKDSIAIAKFGKSGVVLIHPKAGVNLQRVDKILDNYKLSSEEKKLRICVNKNFIANPQLLLIDESEIESVVVTTNVHWQKIEHANSGEEFIDITTKTKNKGDL